VHLVRCLKPDLHHELSAPGGVKNRSYKFLLGFFDLIPDSLEFITFCEEISQQFLNDEFAHECSVTTAAGRRRLVFRISNWSVRLPKAFSLFERRPYMRK
jgi:hypothetical protein